MHREPELTAASELAAAFLATVDDRRVGAADPGDGVRRRLDGPLPDDGEDAERVVRELAGAVDPGLVATAGPRYFGFVTGGALPVAVAAEWLGAVWDQNAGLRVSSPAMAEVEAVAARWVLEALDLPADAGVGFVTGATAANLVGLAAGRHRVLADVGWDVEADGLQGAPRLHLVCGAEAHASVFKAAQCLGLGRSTWHRVDVDDQGRMRPEALAEVLARLDGPTLVAAQAGNVNSGAFDPLDRVAEACGEHGAWLHVDGAFGLWVRANEQLAGPCRGAEAADSWAVDAHKWLNVPYDCGVAIVRDRDAHRAAMTVGAAYLVQEAGRDGLDWGPEASRRARGLPVYAALRHLGRRGVALLVERCCRLARRFAVRLQPEAGVEILNDVVINQVVVSFEPPADEDPAAFHGRLAAAIQDEGTCWVAGTTWQEAPALRLSVSSWRTSIWDVDRSAEAIVAAYRRLTGREA